MKPTAFCHDCTRWHPAGQLAGAGFDVRWEEPTSIDHSVLKFDKLIPTPHSAGVTKEAMQNMGGWAAEQWTNICYGKVPPRIANLEAWSKYRERFHVRLALMPEELSS